MWASSASESRRPERRATAGRQMDALRLRRPSPAAGAIRMRKGLWRSITLEPPGAGGRRASDRYRLVSLGTRTAMKLSTAPGDRVSSRPPRIVGPGRGSMSGQALMTRTKPLERPGLPPPGPGLPAQGMSKYKLGSAVVEAVLIRTLPCWP